MRKICVLALTLLPVVARAQDKEPDWSKIEIKAVKVAGNVYMLEGTGPEFSGGNIGVSVGPDGILLVDDKFVPLAPKIQAALRSVSDKPVRFVLNTHYHGDHTSGNAAFGTSSTIIAHENTRKRLLSPRDGKPVPAAALPVITFEDKLQVHINGEDIRAIHFPAGHTDTDVVVFFTKSNVVHMGDDFFNGMYPFIDEDGGGTVRGYIANIAKLVETIPADARIIPGHGPISSPKELRAFLGMLQETSAIVEAGIKAGKTADQLKKEKALAKYDATWGKGFMKTDDYIDELYRDLAKR